MPLGISPWPTTLSAADDIDAVCGSRGRGGVARSLLGSVSAGLVHNAEMPTLVIRG
jgi:nucleotide-binding universal stress UspA family protein